MTTSRLLFAASSLALILGGCDKLKNNVPGGGNLPSTSLDPNACGGFGTSDAGRKIKAFITATQDLDKVAGETAKIVKDSCVLMGKELGMNDADLGGDDTNGICAKVITAYQENLKVSLKAGAKLKATLKPAECKADLEVQAKAAGECEGKADVGPGGSNASSQCRASGSIKVAAQVQCTPPEVSVEADASMVVNKQKLDMTLKALRDGLPKLLEVKGKVEPLKTAVEQWVVAVKELKDGASDFAKAFQDKAACVSAQIGFLGNMLGHVQANVSVSVSVSASASGSIGG
jgi:hypothetical protein